MRRSELVKRMMRQMKSLRRRLIASLTSHQQSRPKHLQVRMGRSVLEKTMTQIRPHQRKSTASQMTRQLSRPRPRLDRERSVLAKMMNQLRTQQRKLIPNLRLLSMPHDTLLVMLNFSFPRCIVRGFIDGVYLEWRSVLTLVFT
jgi:hypothetical protein